MEKESLLVFIRLCKTSLKEEWNIVPKLSSFVFSGFQKNSSAEC